MITFQAYTLNADVKRIFEAHRLVRVLSAIKQSGSMEVRSMHQNPLPATAYFSDVDVSIVDENSYHLIKKGVPVAFLEKGHNGSWRYFNNPDKLKARFMCLFVVGSDDVDVYHCNPSMTVEENDGIFTVFNTTQVNGVPYQDADYNGQYNQMGVHWYMKGISDGNYIQGGFIASNGYSFKGSSRPDFCRITKNEGAVLSTDYSEGAALADNEVDYIVKQEDLIDGDKETLVLLPILNSTKSSPFRVSVELETLFQER